MWRYRYQYKQRRFHELPERRLCPSVLGWHVSFGRSVRRYHGLPGRHLRRASSYRRHGPNLHCLSGRHLQRIHQQQVLHDVDRVHRWQLRD
jgi:hypothetical protein